MQASEKGEMRRQLDGRSGEEYLGVYDLKLCTSHCPSCFYIESSC